MRSEVIAITYRLITRLKSIQSSVIEVLTALQKPKHIERREELEEYV